MELDDTPQVFRAPEWSLELFFFHHIPLSFVHVPAGTCHYRSVELTVDQSLWISQKPISNELFALVLGKSLEGIQKCGLSWFEAVRFCNRLSELLGYEKVYRLTPRFGVERIVGAKGFRLPFEAEIAYSSRKATRFLFSSCAQEWCQDSYLPERWNCASLNHDSSHQESKKRKEEHVLYTSSSKLVCARPQKQMQDTSFRLVWNG